MRKIYVASSWDNPYQALVVKMLREAGHEIYDFKNPGHGRCEFSWKYVSPTWREWSPQEYRASFDHPRAVSGFLNNFNAMTRATECLILCPSGRSSHIEAGYMSGNGKTVIALMIENQEPELMYACFNQILIGWEEFKSYYNVPE